MRIAIPDQLDQYAVSERQLKALKLRRDLGSNVKAARELGISEASLRNLIGRVKRRAALAGFSPEHAMNQTVPEPFFVKGVSTLYDTDGKVSLQWVKSSVDHEKQLALMREVIDELKQDIKPIAAIPLNKKRDQNQSLLNLYVLTDAHIGMLAWPEECGEAWDLKIAEETIVKAFAYLIDRSPPAKHGFFCQLGDGLHSDSLVPITPTSGNILDQDGRFQKVVRTAVRIFRTVIAMLLEKHETVSVLMAQGNHDMSGSVWLQEMFRALFENNPRVRIIVSPLPYYAHRHGDVMLGFHHGHKANVKQLSGVFMHQFREMLGTTKRTFVHCGHRHHAREMTDSGVVVEQHETLAARDAYAAHGGWPSFRSMQCITYHQKNLEVGRCTYMVGSVE